MECKEHDAAIEKYTEIFQSTCTCKLLDASTTKVKGAGKHGSTGKKWTIVVLKLK